MLNSDIKREREGEESFLFHLPSRPFFFFFCRVEVLQIMIENKCFRKTALIVFDIIISL